jgi:hypothetical protein
MNLGVDLENVREEIKKYIGQNETDNQEAAGDLPITHAGQEGIQ